MAQVARDFPFGAGSYTVGSSTKGVGLGGRSVSFAGGSGTGDIATGQNVSLTQFTLIATLQFNTLSAYAAIIDRDFSTTMRSFQFRRENVNTLSVIRFNTAGGFTSATTVGTMPSDAVVTVAAVVNGLNHSVFLRKEKASNTITGTPQIFDGVMGIGSSWGGTTALTSLTLNGRIFGWALIPRVLPDGEVFQLLDNPWQLFAPVQRRIWVPVAAGADVTVALVGSVATSSAGTLAPSTSKALTGSVATGSTGTLAPSLSAPIAGSVATSAAGALAPSSTVALLGTQAAASAGTITYSAADVTVALSGQAATSSAGTLVNSASIALAGFLAAATAGALTASGGVPDALGALPGGGGYTHDKTRRYGLLPPRTKEELAVLVQAQREALGILPKPVQKRIVAVVKKATKKAEPLATLADFVAQVAQAEQVPAHDVAAAVERAFDYRSAVERAAAVIARAEDTAKREAAETARVMAEEQRVEAERQEHRARLLADDMRLMTFTAEAQRLLAWELADMQRAIAELVEDSGIAAPA